MLLNSPGGSTLQRGADDVFFADTTRLI